MRLAQDDDQGTRNLVLPVRDRVGARLDALLFDAGADARGHLFPPTNAAVLSGVVGDDACDDAEAGSELAVGRVFDLASVAVDDLAKDEELIELGVVDEDLALPRASGSSRRNEGEGSRELRGIHHDMGFLPARAGACVPT